MPQLVQVAAMVFLPLTHVVNITRGLVLGAIDVNLMLIGFVWIAVATVVFFILSINLMKKRLVK
jgi:lipooligosaccharide transport system permease protein